MKLKVLDQIHVSSVSPDTLQPKQEIEVGDLLGKDLMKAHPEKFEVVREAKAKAAPKNKAAETPPNKAADPAENKTEG